MRTTGKKINATDFDRYLAELASDDPIIRQKAAAGLARYTNAEWEATPLAADAAVGPLLVGSREATGPFRAEAARALGNIGARSPTVVSTLIRLLQDDADGTVRTEAARALGKIGAEAAPASRALAAVLKSADGSNALRGEAARALARVAPLAPATAAALRTAAEDRSGHVGVCAAEALWGTCRGDNGAILALAGWLGDPEARDAAAQALYRIGPGAKGAVPALRTAAKDKDRLFQEAAALALRKIDM